MTLLQEVAPSQISAQLTKMWDLLVGTGKMRASLFNLIFFTRQSKRTSYFREIAQKVIEKFPARVLFITEEERDESSFFKTSIAAMFSGQENDVACDLISIQVAPQSRQKIPSVLLPHILPDLPVYLIWAEDPLVQDPLLYQLLPLASRLIFDSEASPSLPLFAKMLLRLREQTGIEIADLNWARTESWRDLFCMTFQSEKRLEQLKKSKKFSLTYNNQISDFFSKPQLSSLLFISWLSAQMQWQFQRGEQLLSQEPSLHYQTSYGEVAISLFSRSLPSHYAANLSQVEIQTEKSHFLFSASPQLPHQIRILISGAEACELPSLYFFPKAESGQSLVKEICHKGTSSHFLHALKQIEKLPFPLIDQNRSLA